MAALVEEIPDAVQEESIAELQRMLQLNVKAEMQILDERSRGGLVDWLDARIGQHLMMTGS